MNKLQNELDRLHKKSYDLHLVELKTRIQIEFSPLWGTECFIKRNMPLFTAGIQLRKGKNPAVFLAFSRIAGYIYLQNKNRRH